MNEMTGKQVAPEGYIRGFQFIDGKAVALDWATASTLPGEQHAPCWLHLAGTDEHIDAWIDTLEMLPPGVRSFLGGTDKRPRLHVGVGFMYGVIADLELGGEPDIDKDKGALRFFVDQKRLLTVRARALQSTDRLRHAVLDGDAFSDTIDLFASLIGALNEGFAERVNDLGEQLDDIEEAVLDGHHNELRSALGALRRSLVELKRYVDPERTALAQLIGKRLDWAEPRSSEALVQAVQALNGIGGALEALYERAKLMQEEMASLLAENINRKLLVLSIMSALLLPATLVTGVFGMNVAGLPGLHNQHSFWIVTGMMVVLAACTLGVLKKFKLW
ncbi:CorA family divalent cation transporter [Chitinasiproducens palmae]|uniref:Zinc transporter n=1 Tax=Chitinasiproducens palmae TaxID=1770053 RepID=A0A1H2PUR5_9BURK|nr:CorA family divalent cation transporter [Chitinasiproducens palmae]SDV50957.1 zinc transporter [Chitinasiproducens palmae]